MDSNDWLDRWKRGETGWHQSEVEPHLVANFSDLKPTRVFVPLCGKSLDLSWLASRGHEVVGIELSELAARAFFSEQGIPVEEIRVRELQALRSRSITIFVGSFFELRAGDLGPIGAVYDRAALIALPAEARQRYAAHLVTLVKECSVAPIPPRFLQIVLDQIPAHVGGPPFSVSMRELEALYGHSFTLTLLSRGKVDLGGSRGGQAMECVYFMRPRAVSKD